MIHTWFACDFACDLLWCIQRVCIRYKCLVFPLRYNIAKGLRRSRCSRFF